MYRDLSYKGFHELLFCWNYSIGALSILWDPSYKDFFLIRIYYKRIYSIRISRVGALFYEDFFQGPQESLWHAGLDSIGIVSYGDLFYNDLFYRDSFYKDLSHRPYCIKINSTGIYSARNLFYRNTIL